MLLLFLPMFSLDGDIVHISPSIEHCGFRLLSFLNRLWLQIKERRSRSHVLVGSALCVCVCV